MSSFSLFRICPFNSCRQSFTLVDLLSLFSSQVYSKSVVKIPFYAWITRDWKRRIWGFILLTIMIIWGMRHSLGLWERERAVKCIQREDESDGPSLSPSFLSSSIQVWKQWSLFVFFVVVSPPYFFSYSWSYSLFSVLPFGWQRFQRQFNTRITCQHRLQGRQWVRKEKKGHRKHWLNRTEVTLKNIRSKCSFLSLSLYVCLSLFLSVSFPCSCSCWDDFGQERERNQFDTP